MGSGIGENLSRLRGEVLAAAVKAGRDPADIKIIAVTKGVPVGRMLEAVREGITDLGENRVQELLAKQPRFGPEVRWHLIGHLQTNKVKSVVGRVRLIHSLDSWRLACEIDRRSREAGVVSEVLVQVNVSGEDTKHGLAPAEVQDFIKSALELPGISVRGLMTVAPLVEDPEEARPVFRELKRLFDSIREAVPSVPMAYLSMGMTNDYRVAVEEGSNILRVGAAIFGAR
ncbi:MAG: YggS family pyridoxal phosphate-dependent enzyme [Peptococcaceae bacterium]|nr:YggS family pyridoxal phosphate-dependent enzyme [Peptococcaceae bacterium]